MIAVYRNLLNDNHKLWESMVAVVTKIGWDEDEYDGDLTQWIAVMELYKSNLRKELIKHFGENATPTVLAIS